MHKGFAAALLAVAVAHGAAYAQPKVKSIMPLGDAARGRTVYEDRCSACHSLDANRVGPAHRGVYGRKAGSAPGYAYSPGVSASRVIWREATLDRWLTNPQGFIPGAAMGFQLGDAQERADVIAYLKQQSPPPPAARKK